MQLVLPLERVAVKKRRKAIWNIAVLVADFSGREILEEFALAHLGKLVRMSCSGRGSSIPG
jgi:hypothetical protein